MFKNYYKQQLALLEDYASQFSEQNPIAAGLLSDADTEPDTRRLMQAFAFLTANIQRELDGQFPRLLHSLTQMISPHYLTPRPSATIVEFTGKSNLLEPITIDRHAEIGSNDSSTEDVVFRTTRNLTVYPIKVDKAVDLKMLQQEGENQNRELQVDFKVQGVNVNNFEMPQIEFFIDDVFGKAADLYYFLSHCVKDVYISVDGQRIKRLGADNITVGGLSSDESLFPGEGMDLPIYDMLTDYFSYPEKFLFLKLDISEWVDRPEAAAFSLIFSGEEPDFPLPEIKASHFRLNCVPCVNLFSHSTEPMLLDDYAEKLHLVPAKQRSKNTQKYIYAVDQVASLSRGETLEKREYQPINQFNTIDESSARYSLFFEPAINRAGSEVYISLAFSGQNTPQNGEVLKTEVTCYNGEIAEKINPGDLCRATGDTPELVSFRNLYSPSMCCEPSLTDERLWMVLSDLSLNMSSLEDENTLKAVLKNYVTKDERNESSYQRSLRVVDSIVRVNAVSEEMLYGQALLRGLKIQITVKSQDFPGVGAYYLFGCLINQLFSSHSPINSYTQLEFKDFYSGNSLIWPAQLGSKRLI